MLYRNKFILKDYQLLIDKIPIGIGISDKKGDIIISNKAMEDIFGYTKENLHRLGVNALFTSFKDRDYLLDILKREHKVRDFELTMKTRDDTIYAMLNIDMEKVEGEVIFHTTLQDITEQKRAEKSLIDSEERYRALYMNIPVPTYTWQKEGDNLVLIDYNDAGRAITQGKAKGFLGKKVTDVYADRMYIAEDMLRCLREKTVISKITEHYLTLINKMLYFDLKYAYIPPDLVLVLTEDITEKKEAELKIKQSEKKYRKAYTRAEFYKDLFAHDINNLLQGILLSSQIIENKLTKKEVFPQIEKPLSIIKEIVHRGSDLVKNIHKLSQLEEKTDALEKVEVIKILREIISSFRVQYSDQSVNISFESEADELFIMGNELIKDVFENLISNAFNHNKSPLKEINIRFSKIGDESVFFIKMEFIDNGIGIEEERKNAIFKRRQIATSKGLGLGLSLVSKIMNLYNGKIYVENRISDDYTKGSNFIILIPEFI